MEFQLLTYFKLFLVLVKYFTIYTCNGLMDKDRTHWGTRSEMQPTDEKQEHSLNLFKMIPSDLEVPVL